MKLPYNVGGNSAPAPVLMWYVIVKPVCLMPPTMMLPTITPALIRARLAHNKASLALL